MGRVAEALAGIGGALMKAFNSYQLINMTKDLPGGPSLDPETARLQMLLGAYDKSNKPFDPSNPQSMTLDEWVKYTEGMKNLKAHTGRGDGTSSPSDENYGVPGKTVEAAGVRGIAAQKYAAEMAKANEANAARSQRLSSLGISDESNPSGFMGLAPETTKQFIGTPSKVPTKKEVGQQVVSDLLLGKLNNLGVDTTPLKQKPAGAVGTAKNRATGQLHWVDANGNDLGPQ